jgi:hypothetical protein
MAEFLTTRGVASKLENIISDSKKYLFLLSAYIHIPTGLIPEINAAIKRKVRVVLVYGKKAELTDHRLDRLKEITGSIEIYYNARLHAKAYLNESECIITSLNLLEFSEVNNIEFGIAADKNHEIFKKLKEKIDVVISECEKVRITTQGKLEFLGRATEFKPIDDVGSIAISAWCIRCGVSIRYNRNAPLCEKCYKSWVKYEDGSYPEKNCHQCGGEFMGIDKDHPVCKKCYKKGEPILN